MGIVEYISNAPGIRGILKQRYSDFVVREFIDGRIVQLSSIDGKEIENRLFPKTAPAAHFPDDINKFMEQIVALGVLLDAKQSTELTSYLIGCLDKSASIDSEFTAFPCTAKQTRSTVHQLIKDKLANIVDGDTVNVDGVQHIRFKAKHKFNRGKTSDFKRAEQWPAGVGNYLQFSLLKGAPQFLDSLLVYLTRCYREHRYHERHGDFAKASPNEVRWNRICWHQGQTRSDRSVMYSVSSQALRLQPPQFIRSSSFFTSWRLSVCR